MDVVAATFVAEQIRIAIHNQLKKRVHDTELPFLTNSETMLQRICWTEAEEFVRAILEKAKPCKRPRENADRQRTFAQEKCRTTAEEFVNAMLLKIKPLRCTDAKNDRLGKSVQSLELHDCEVLVSRFATECIAAVLDNMTQRVSHDSATPIAPKAEPQQCFDPVKSMDNQSMDGMDDTVRMEVRSRVARTVYYDSILPVANKHVYLSLFPSRVAIHEHKDAAVTVGNDTENGHGAITSDQSNEQPSCMVLIPDKLNNDLQHEGNNEMASSTGVGDFLDQNDFKLVPSNDNEAPHETSHPTNAVNNDVTSFSCKHAAREFVNILVLQAIQEIKSALVPPLQPDPVVISLSVSPSTDPHLEPKKTPRRKSPNLHKRTLVHKKHTTEETINVPLELERSLPPVQPPTPVTPVEFVDSTVIPMLAIPKSPQEPLPMPIVPSKRKQQPTKSKHTTRLDQINPPQLQCKVEHITPTKSTVSASDADAVECNRAPISSARTAIEIYQRPQVLVQAETHGNRTKQPPSHAKTSPTRLFPLAKPPPSPIMPAIASPLKKPTSTAQISPIKQKTSGIKPLGKTLSSSTKMRSGYCQLCVFEGRSCKINDCLKHQLLAGK